MAHDVFISYSAKDKQIADAVCAMLEGKNIRCFIAPRDMPVGNFPEALNDAINDSKIFVLVLSPNVNASKFVIKEVRLAIEKGVTIIPFRIEDFELSGAFDFLVGDIHWLDALTPPMEKHLKTLSNKVNAILHPAIIGDSELENDTAQKPLYANESGFRKSFTAYKKTILITALLALVAIPLIVKFWYFPDKETVSNQSPQYSSQYLTNRDSFIGALPWLRWIIYDPTESDPFQNKEASEASIRKDLQVLRQYGFNGLITMTSKGTSQHIAKIARQEGFQMVIVGVWDLRDEGEIVNALQSAAFSDAYCLGHRGLNKRYNLGELEALMETFRQKTNRPVTTSELLDNYEMNARFAGLGDFLFPDVHASWHQGQTPQEAWDETLKFARRAAQISGNMNGKLVLLKMVSYPSGGAKGLSPQAQSQFYRLAVEESVDRNDIPASISFSFLTAFDPVWKTKGDDWVPAEQFTGLFTKDRIPKPAVTDVKWKKNR